MPHYSEWKETKPPKLFGQFFSKSELAFTTPASGWHQHKLTCGAGIRTFLTLRTRCARGSARQGVRTRRARYPHVLSKKKLREVFCHRLFVKKSTFSQSSMCAEIFTSRRCSAGTLQVIEAEEHVFWPAQHTRTLWGASQNTAMCTLTSETTSSGDHSLDVWAFVSGGTFHARLFIPVWVTPGCTLLHSVFSFVRAFKTRIAAGAWRCPDVTKLTCNATGEIH